LDYYANTFMVEVRHDDCRMSVCCYIFKGGVE
jgi:hypothetical protein